MPGIQALDEFLERLRALKESLARADWTVPEPPEFDPLGQWKLRPILVGAPPVAPPGQTLDELRHELPERIRAYLNSESDAVLLVKVPPGVGKTHASVGVAQDFAGSGYRGLWCGQRHNMFTEIAALPHFEPRRWYHWQPISGQIDDEPACRYAEYQAAWTARGYSAMDLCRQVCRPDNWIKKCAYRRQEKAKARLIFAQHQHLTAGIAINKFDFAVVDELPLGAFVDDRLIGVDHMAVGATGPLGDLIAELRVLCGTVTERRRLAGRALFEKVGELVGDAIAAVEIKVGVPVPPRVHGPTEVERAPYWYVYDLVELLASEYAAWRAGWPAWNETVWLTRGGIHLLQRAEPWKHLPAKLVVLDATAQPDLYRMIFRREVEVYAPLARRAGRLYQVAGRQNGKGLAVAKGELTAAGREMLETARQLAAGAERPGLICWKALRPHAEKYFDLVMTFGALRGSNHMEQCDVVIVLGTYTPNQESMLDLATAITGQREPFHEADETGARQPIHRPTMRAYRLTEAGLMQVRTLWPDSQGVERQIKEYAHPALRAIHEQLREAELVQAIHRARINVRATTVWLLTSTPTDEPLDALYEEPPIGPAGIHWKVWTKLEPWLADRHTQGAAVTSADIAQAMNSTAKYVQDNKWLDAIVAHYAGAWEIDAIRPAKGTAGGQPKKAIRPA